MAAEIIKILVVCVAVAGILGDGYATIRAARRGDVATIQAGGVLLCFYAILFAIATR